MNINILIAKGGGLSPFAPPCLRLCVQTPWREALEARGPMRLHRLHRLKAGLACEGVNCLCKLSTVQQKDSL